MVAQAAKAAQQRAVEEGNETQAAGALEIAFTKFRIAEKLAEVGVHRIEAGMPVVFDVLCHEIRGLGMNIELEKSHDDVGPLL